MKGQTLKQLARLIEAAFPDLVATAEPGRGYCNTDRDIPGTRLRRPGKGRTGTLLTVRRRLPKTCSGRSHDYRLGESCSYCGERRDGIVFQHNAAETYRRNQDVVDWIAAERNRRAGR